jgi:hypothetical protein
MKNVTTPRMLADCTFRTGYQTAQLPQRSRLADVLLATAIGAVLAVALVHWWAS